MQNVKNDEISDIYYPLIIGGNPIPGRSVEDSMVSNSAKRLDDSSCLLKDTIKIKWLLKIIKKMSTDNVTMSLVN